MVKASEVDGQRRTVVAIVLVPHGHVMRSLVESEKLKAFHAGRTQADAEGFLISLSS